MDMLPMLFLFVIGVKEREKVFVSSVKKARSVISHGVGGARLVIMPWYVAVEALMHAKEAEEM